MPVRGIGNTGVDSIEGFMDEATKVLTKQGLNERCGHGFTFCIAVNNCISKFIEID